MTATRRQLSRAQLIESARLAARISGCSCVPDVKLRELRPGVFVADLAHDGDCKHPSQQKGREA
jgi:hypothetical protein